MASLEARGLHMRFGDRVVLEDISLVFPDREFTGIMGPNGAGKTTSFNVLTGRYRPSRGTVLLDGEDITGLPPRAIARKGVARSFQTMNLFNDFSALDNVALAVPENRARGFAMLGKTRQDSVAGGQGLSGALASGTSRQSRCAGQEPVVRRPACARNRHRTCGRTRRAVPR